MKEDILNIINLEEITKVRSSLNNSGMALKQNSLVSLIPLELLEKGTKVLIDGKLFIAFIDGKVPLKEEIIAFVSNAAPLRLTLNYNEKIFSNTQLFDQLLNRLELKKNQSNIELLKAIANEDKPFIKSKIKQLQNFQAKYQPQSLELALLVNLVWDYSTDESIFIEELYENLFDKSYENVCEDLYKNISELIFTDLQSTILKKINSELIFDPEENNISAISQKQKSIISIIKNVVEYYSNGRSLQLQSFIELASTYILQKAVLKNYDFNPDFVIVRKDNELELVRYSIKKSYSPNDLPIYKLNFSHNSLPVELSGIIKEGVFLGSIEGVSETAELLNEVNNFQTQFDNKTKIKSNINFGKSINENVEISKIKKGLNKLVS